MPKNIKFWNVARNGNGNADIWLEGEITSRHPTDWMGNAIEGNFITPDDLNKDLEEISDAKEVTVHINSCGGEVYTAIAIHNALKALDADVKVVIDGVALSGASVIAMAGKTIEMYPGSLMMIHQVSAFISEWTMTLDDLKKYENACEAMEEAIASIYAEKTGKTVDDCRMLMNNETWMSGSKAVENGFADRVIEDAKAVNVAYNDVSHALFVNKCVFDAGNLKIPEGIKRTKKKKSADNTAGSGRKEENIMDIKELREKYPDLVAQVETEAANSARDAERSRIREIDEISSNISDQEAVRNAKYGEKPMNASDLAFSYLKNAKNLGQQFLDGMKKGADESGVNTVNSVPSGNPVSKTPENEEQEALNKISGLFK